ncbi:MAG: hypothetical protein MUC87_04445 [Bacteroidia bacterium]|jgi:hypothetical protein|nr:hypothetical protein [Bacteroidia bacterium]
MKYIASLPLFLMPLAGGLMAQSEKPARQLPLVAAGVGGTYFGGDVGSGGTTSFNTSLRTCWRLSVEQRFGKWAGIQLGGFYGTLSGSDRSLALNRNFESSLVQGQLSGLLFFDKGDRTRLFSPYLGAGVGYMLFDPHGDLRDANGVLYNYWSDGSIRNYPEQSMIALPSVMLQRDYVYETKLTDSTANYNRNTLLLPLMAGVRLQYSYRLGIDMNVCWNMAFTDYIDNVKDGGNDSYWWAGVSVYYHFGKPPATEQQNARFADVDFNSMMNADSDSDGVKDIDDQCAGTPAGVETDSKGCPKDRDGDGYPDYLDKEPDTPKGMSTDANGVGIDWKKIEEQARLDSIAAVQDSLKQAFKTRFENEPSSQVLQQASPQTTTTQGTAPNGNRRIPAELQPADKNNDDLITADEINKAIDEFFDGTGNWTADKINRLIDYFFEQ